MKIIRLTLAAFFILAFISVSFQSFADEKDEVIVLFDQSSSFKKPDPRLLSRTWLLTFIQAFNEPCRVVFVGFDENIHEHFSMVVSADMNMDALSQKIGEIDARGRLTDMEMPFKYLLERGRNDAVKLVLIVSDGEPDIWDGKLRRFSKAIKFDNRYEDLNRRYWELKKSNLSPDELFVRLRHLYYKKNLEITEKQASRLKDVLGDRILIWDLSGESEHLKNWAKKSGARYWPANANPKESPIEDIESFVLTVLKTLSAEARESFSKNRLHPETAETKQKPLPSASVIDKARQFKEVVEDKVKTGEKGNLKKALDVGHSKQDHAPLMMIVPVIIVSVAGIAIAIARSRKRPVKDASGSKKTSAGRQAKEQAVNTASPAIEELEKTMGDEIRNALKDAEELQNRLLGKTEESFRVDNEFSMDVSVPTGVMEVHWIGEDGKKVWGRAVTISEKKVLFEEDTDMTKATLHILGTEKGQLDLEVKHQEILTGPVSEIAERQRALEADMYEDIEILRKRKIAEMDSELAGWKSAKQQALVDIHVSIGMLVFCLKSAKQHALEKELTKLKKEQQDEIFASKQLAEQEIKAKKEKALKDVSEWAKQQKINIRERFELKYQERLKAFHKEYTDNIKMEFEKTREYFTNLAKEKKALMEKNIEGS